jgi:hypothetical protein
VGDLLVLREWARRYLSVESIGIDPEDEYPCPLVWFNEGLRSVDDTSWASDLGYSCIVVSPPEPNISPTSSAFFECIVLWGGTLLSVDDSDMYRYFDLLPSARRDL